MGTMAAIAGAIGGLCAVLGIVTALEVDMPLGDQFTWMFWFVLAVILLLASIALGGGRGAGSD
jgi:ABC-type Mn2+/Zn2+ transport system permease subunit